MSSTLRGQTTGATPTGGRAGSHIHTSKGARRDDRRAMAWHRFDVAGGIEVCISHPGGSRTCMRVTPRELSAGGLRFEHTNFIYPGSCCVCNLPAKVEALVSVRGRITNCVHLSGRAHEVSVAFDGAIELGDFVDAPGASPASRPPGCATAGGREAGRR